MAGWVGAISNMTGNKARNYVRGISPLLSSRAIKWRVSADQTAVITEILILSGLILTSVVTPSALLKPKMNRSKMWHVHQVCVKYKFKAIIM